MSLHLDYCAEFGLSKNEVEEQEEHQGKTLTLSSCCKKKPVQLTIHSLHGLHPLRPRHSALRKLVRATNCLRALPSGLWHHRKKALGRPGNGEGAGQSVLEVDTELCGG